MGGQLTRQERLRKIISDPANDAQMIDGTLTLKRFADKAVSGLFDPDTTTTSRPTLTAADMVNIKPTGGEDDARGEVRRRLELEDAIRVGFKLGMGSRQNAPAEWIGSSPFVLRALSDQLSQTSR